MVLNVEISLQVAHLNKYGLLSFNYDLTCKREEKNSYVGDGKYVVKFCRFYTRRRYRKYFRVDEETAKWLNRVEDGTAFSLVAQQFANYEKLIIPLELLTSKTNANNFLSVNG